MCCDCVHTIIEADCTNWLIVQCLLKAQSVVANNASSLKHLHSKSLGFKSGLWNKSHSEDFSFSE